jgi:hypothetical protein
MNWPRRLKRALGIEIEQCASAAAELAVLISWLSLTLALRGASSGRRSAP